jgi:hypothetical protein
MPRYFSHDGTDPPRYFSRRRTFLREESVRRHRNKSGNKNDNIPDGLVPLSILPEPIHALLLLS